MGDSEAQQTCAHKQDIDAIDAVGVIMFSVNAALATTVIIKL